MSATVEALPQHMTALQRAQYIRLHRGALKREVRSYRGPDAYDIGRHKIAAVLLLPVENREVFSSENVVEMLCWIRNMQRSVAVRYAAACDVSEFKTIGELTDRQRLRLVGLIQGGIEALRETEDDRDAARWAAERGTRVVA